MGRVFNNKIWATDRYTSSTDGTLHDSGREKEKICIILQFKKEPESIDKYLTCHAFSLQDARAYLATENPSTIKSKLDDKEQLRASCLK